jgi:hypothetical protein
MSEAKEQVPASGKGSSMKRVVGAVLLLLGGAGAGFGGAVAVGVTGEASGHDAEAGDGGGHGEADAGGHGEASGGHGGGIALLPRRGTSRAVVNLGTFTVNLRGSGGGRVLRTEVQVEVDGADESVVDENMAVLRDAVITLASDFTFADLEGVDGKTHLRDELLGRLNSVTSRAPEVGRVYFTEFVVQ